MVVGCCAVAAAARSKDRDCRRRCQDCSYCYGTGTDAGCDRRPTCCAGCRRPTACCCRATLLRLVVGLGKKVTRNSQGQQQDQYD